MKDAYVVAGARTPFGSFGGSLKDVAAEELALYAAQGALERASVNPERVDNVVFGNVVQSSPNAAYFARHVGLRAGAPESAPALTVNRLCGSGLQAVISAVESILLGHSDLALAGGAESMSRIPYAMHGARFGFGPGKPELTDMLWATLKDEYAGCGMGETAENLASDFQLDRLRQDEFALRSHHRAAAARSLLREEIVPVSVRSRGRETIIEEDEHIRPDTTVEQLARLRPAFREGGTVTAGNASGINDGAAAVVVASREGLGQVEPLARVVSYAVVGVDPSRMGIGPVPAIRLALERADMRLSDMDIVEVNEAFASQTLAVQTELQIEDEKLNALGGAIALGHPVGASGARLLLSAALRLRRERLRRAVVSLCIGGGQGIAMIIERA